MHKNALFLLFDPSLPKSRIHDKHIVCFLSCFKIVCPSMAEVCIICNSSNLNLVTCRDTIPWTTLHCIAVLRDHKAVLGLCSGENVFPLFPYNTCKERSFLDRSSHTKGIFRPRRLLRATKVTFHQEEV